LEGGQGFLGEGLSPAEPGYVEILEVREGTGTGSVEGKTKGEGREGKQEGEAYLVRHSRHLQ
jgi:hypothetical protein